MLDKIDQINEKVGKVASFAIWGGALILFFEVFARYLKRHSIVLHLEI